MSITIITNEPFPYGRAATNRILSYGKGFIENGNDVDVLCLKSSKVYEKQNCYANNSFEGIKYQYLSGTTKRGSSFLKRRLLSLRSYVMLFYFLRKNRTDFIILYASPFFIMFITSVFARILNLKIIKEESEYPVVYIKPNNAIKRFYLFLYENFAYRLFSKFIFETDNLKKYFSSKISKKSSAIIVPPTIDYKRYEKIVKLEKNKNRYIAYCGTLDRIKNDGIPILIKSFIKIAYKFKDVKLYIIGYCSNLNDLEFYKKIVSESNMSDRVIFTDKISQKKLDEYLVNANILALAKPKDDITTGGLSSKVIEYLFTGNITVITNVNEISKYLKDKKDTLFAKAGDINDFANKLQFALENEEISQKIGLSGKQKALKYFNYVIHTKRIIEFVNN